MTIASISAGVPRADYLPSGASAQTFAGPLFADLLARLDQSAAAGNELKVSGPALDPPVDLLQFNVATNVSASAIRFDARPLLGEISLSLSEERHSPPAPQAMTPQTDKLSLAPAAIGGSSEQVRCLLGGLTQQFGVEAASISIQPVQPDPGLTGTTGSHAAAPTVVSLRRADGVVSASRVSPSPSPQLAQSTQNKVMYARLAMHPLELRLVIHGAQLSANELAVLAEELTGLLAGTCFADRPIKILAALRKG